MSIGNEHSVYEAEHKLGLMKMKDALEHRPNVSHNLVQVPLSCEALLRPRSRILHLHHLHET